MMGLAIIVVGITFTFLFINYNPAFGGKVSREQLIKYRKSKNYFKGKFINQIPTSLDIRAKTIFTLLRDLIKRNPNVRPDRPIPLEPQNFSLVQDTKQSRITWLGHSAFLLELEGKTLMLDPMLGKFSSPLPFFGPKRYSETLPQILEELSAIDVVLISHDHYDHLDYETIMKIKEKVKWFLVPLGLRRHLERWGVSQERVKEFDWWQEVNIEGLTLTCTPARHFSGRGLTDRNSSLWCSWVISGNHGRIYFSGDSSYGPHFTEIGDKYGPFDLTLMECGQYDERWSDFHMLPEETLRAHLDVKGKIMIPIHWCAFVLAFHDWAEPVERATLAADKLDVKIATPRIGEKVIIGSPEYPNSKWWR